MKKLIFTLVAALAIGSFAMAQSQGPRPGTVPADDFTIGPGTDGNTVSLLNTVNGGTVVVLDFMATWCGPCASSTPKISTINTEYAEQVAVWAVDIDDRESVSLIATKTASWGANYEGFAQGRFVFDFYWGSTGGYSIPYIAVVGCEGEIFMNGNNSGSGGGYSDFTVRAAIDAAILKMGACNTGINDPAAESIVTLYPNPATTSTHIAVAVKNTADVTVVIYNVLGEKVAAPFAQIVKGGVQEVINVNTSSYAPGLYMVNVQMGDQSEMIKLNVIK